MNLLEVYEETEEGLQFRFVPSARRRDQFLPMLLIRNCWRKIGEAAVRDLLP